jgi:hypothetical protein
MAFWPFFGGGNHGWLCGDISRPIYGCQSESDILGHLKDQFMQNMKMCELSEGWKKNMNELEGSVNGFSSKMNPLSEIAKSVIPEQNRIISLVESWVGGLRELEHQQRVV